MASNTCWTVSTLDIGILFYGGDRTARRGGGVLKELNESLEYCDVNVATSLEFVFARLHCAYKNVILYVCHHSPDFPASFGGIYMMFWMQFVLNFHWYLCFSWTILTLPHIDWSGAFSSATCNSSPYVDFLNICSNFSLSQLVTEHTWITDSSCNVSDVILTITLDIISLINQALVITRRYISTYLQRCVLP